jgi:hypothetical protein
VWFKFRQPGLPSRFRALARSQNDPARRRLPSVTLEHPGRKSTGKSPEKTPKQEPASEMRTMQVLFARSFRYFFDFFMNALLTIQKRA